MPGVLVRFFLVPLTLFGFMVHGQNKATNSSNKIDSLYRLLSLAKQDTVKVRLHFQIGVESKIGRISHWDSLLVRANKNNLPSFECKILNQMGLIYWSSDKTKAIECFNKGLLIAEDAGNKALMLPIIKNLAAIYFGNYTYATKALDLNYRGLKLAEELNDKMAALDFYSYIGTSYFFSGEIDKALKMHFNCLKICREIKYNLGIGIGLTDIASDYLALKDDKRAAYYYLESKRYAHEFEGTSDGAYIFNSVASGYAIIHHYDSAYKYSHAAYKIFEAIGSKEGMSSTMLVMSNSLLERGDLKRAKELVMRALELSRQAGFVVQIPGLARHLKEIYLREGDYKAAFDAYKLEVNTKDSLSNLDIRKKSIEKEFNYNLEKKESENKLLAQQNQIQTLQLNQNKYLIFGFVVLVLLIFVIAGLMLRQNMLRAKQQSMFLEQKLISSQMNPHFVFNSLNSIQHLIMTKENEKAELYLSKFAKLIRELLESNNKGSLTIAEEVVILKGYMEMEARRFGKSISFSIHLDERIEQEKMSIPHMMIQPFLENAIWHGILPSTNGGNVSVDFEYLSDKTIKCTIEDNGVGREASRKRTSTFKKKSLALSFVKQRLKLMEKTLKINCSVDIMDMKNDVGESLGTKVELILPILI